MSILKIVGIVILCVIAFLLLMLMLILFVPYRYKVHGEKIEKICAYAKVTWLLHFVVVLLTYDDGINLRIKILGIPFYDKKRKEQKAKLKEEKERLKAQKEAEKKKSRKKKEEDGSGTGDEEVEVIKDDDGSTESTDSVAEQEAKSDAVPDEDKDGGSQKKADGKKSFGRTVEELTEKAEDILDKLSDMVDEGEEAVCDKIERLFEKIHDLIDTVDYYHRLLCSDGAAWVYEHVKKHVIGILKAIRPTRTDACINIADDDPGKVAKVYEYQVFALPVIEAVRGRRGVIDINAYQDDKYFDISATVKGRVLLAAVAWHGALIILNKKVRYFIKRLKREEAEEKS